MNRLTRKLNKLILQFHRSYHADFSLSTIADRKKKKRLSSLVGKEGKKITRDGKFTWEFIELGNL